MTTTRTPRPAVTVAGTVPPGQPIPIPVPGDLRRGGTVEVAGDGDRRVLLLLRERSYEINDVAISLPVSATQSLVRSLRLAVRLAAAVDVPGRHPVWCEPRNHLANWEHCSATTGELDVGRQTVDVALYRAHGTGLTVVSLYAGHRNGPDGMVDMDPAEAARVAELLHAARAAGGAP
jgi:hypothetical protein